MWNFCKLPKNLPSMTHTAHHLVGPHHDYRGLDHTDQPAISETIHQRRLAILGHVSRMSLSMDTHRAIYQHLPSDWRRRPGRPWQTPDWQVYVVICGNLASNWPTFHSLLLTVHCTGEWLACVGVRASASHITKRRTHMIPAKLPVEMLHNSKYSHGVESSCQHSVICLFSRPAW